MKTSRSQGSSDDGNATLRLHFLKPFTKEEVESFKFSSLIHGCLAKAMVSPHAQECVAQNVLKTLCAGDRGGDLSQAAGAALLHALLPHG